MGVDRTDYLMWGAKVNPDAVDIDEFEQEIDGAVGRRFDLVYDGMSGQYAVAGEIIAKSEPYEGLEFHEISPDDFSTVNSRMVRAVTAAFPDAGEFKLFLFSHFD